MSASAEPVSAVASDELQARVAELVQQQLAAARRGKRATFVVFSGEMDRLLAAFTMANATAAMGMQTTMFFTFWGLTGVRCRRRYRGKGLIGRMLSRMLPDGPQSVPASRMNFGGAGPILFRHLMRREGVADLSSLVESARQLGVRMVACETSTAVMGIGIDELLPGIEVAGAAACMADASESDVSLFC